MARVEGQGYREVNLRHCELTFDSAAPECISILIEFALPFRICRVEEVNRSREIVEQEGSRKSGDRGLIQRGKLQQRELGKIAKQSNMIVEEHMKVSRDKEEYLTRAMQHYANSLACGAAESSNKHDIRAVFRLISLGLKSPSRLEESINRVPPRKLIPSINQIVSRLGSEDEDGGRIIDNLFRKLVRRVALSHPHHCLFQLFALRNGAHTVAKPDGATFFKTDEKKIQAAEDVIEQLRAVSSLLIRIRCRDPLAVMSAGRDAFGFARNGAANQMLPRAERHRCS